MARVDAMSMASAATVSLANAAGKVSVSEGVQSFEQFMSNRPAVNSENLQKASKSLGAKNNTLTERTAESAQTESIPKKAEDGLCAEHQNPEKVSEDMQEIAGQIREEIKDCFDMDDAQFEEALQEMGISVFDLLNPQILQQFVLTQNQAETQADFLTNEGMLATLNQLMESFAELADELQKLLAQMDVISDVSTSVEMELDAEMPQIMQETDVEAALQQTEDIVSEEAVKQDVAVQQKGISVEEVPGQENEKTENDSVITVVKDKAVQENALAQDDSAEEELFQDGDAQLFSETEITAEQDKTVPELFGTQFQDAKGNIGKLFESNVLPSQKMQQMIDIVHQVSNQIRSHVNANTTTLEMQLNPESLGKVVLTVASKDGVMTANFRVESEEAKNALESQMVSLKEIFHEKNLRVESVDVEISEFNFTQSNNETKKQMEEELAKETKKKFRFAEELEEDVAQEEEEQLRRRVMRDAGGSIDFTA